MPAKDGARTEIQKEPKKCKFALHLFLVILVQVYIYTGVLQAETLV